MGKKKKAGEIRIPFRLWYALAVAFLAIPIVIFCLGYLRWYVGIPFALCFAGFSVYSVIDCTKPAKGKPELASRTGDITIKLKYLIGFAVFAVFLSYFMGVGEFIYSLQDHPFRRAMLSDLISYKWPVIYNYSTQTNPDVIKLIGKTSGDTAFVYYFTYWMPAALFGKVFGRGAADVFLMLWTAFGIFLTLLGMVKINGRACFTQPAFYMFFGGLDVIPTLVYYVTGYSLWESMEGYVPHMSYYCNMCELGNVFHQAVPTYLITVLIILSVNTRSFGLTGGLSFAYSPFAVFGLLPVIGTAILRKDMRQDVKGTLKDFFTPANIIPAALMLLIYGSFYSANSGAVGDSGFTFTFFDSFWIFLICYICFIAVDVFPISAVLFKRKKKDAFYLCAVVSLVLIPLCLMTWTNDFCMRASMPARFILLVFLAGLFKDLYDEDAVRPPKKKRSKKELTGLVFAILATLLMTFPGIVNAYLIAGSQLTGEADRKDRVGSFGNINVSQDADGEYAYIVNKQFFADRYRDSLFFRYLGKS